MSHDLLPALDRRRFLAGATAFGGSMLAGAPGVLAQPAPMLTVASRTIEVGRKAAKVFAVTGAGGRSGIFANEGDRFAGALRNDSGEPLTMHWHGQIKAPADQDRARPDGGALGVGLNDTHDFELTTGTHWMHSHTLSEQQLLAAPMVAREKNAGDVQDVVMMLHDFSFRAPQEILAGLGGSDGHGAHTSQAAPAAQPMAGGHAGHSMPMDHSGHDMGAMKQQHAGHQMGMVHANDVAYDAYLANDRTLADPEVVKVEKGGRVRLRIINGATATSFFISTPGLKATCVAVDGTPCQPVAATTVPLTQGQRVDLVVEIPAGGGAFPILAQVEAARFLTGIVLATAGAAVARQPSEASKAGGLLDLAFETKLRALTPLASRTANRRYRVMLGEAAGYRWTINGKVHGEHTPFEAKVGERVELTFMNPTSMMHPMHIHGHHFQVLSIGGKSFLGAMRDTMIVPPHMPVTVAFDAAQKGAWFLHCHHLYHMATGMMTEVHIS